MSLGAKLGIGGAVLALLGFLVWLYGGARYKAGKADERTAWQEVVAKAERDKLTAYQAGVASVMGAESRYVETVRTQIVPVTRTIVERSTAYAQTPEGRAICLPADRVGLLEQTRASLFTTPAAAAPAGSASAVRPDGVAPGN